MISTDDVVGGGDGLRNQVAGSLPFSSRGLDGTWERGAERRPSRLTALVVLTLLSVVLAVVAFALRSVASGGLRTPASAPAVSTR